MTIYIHPTAEVSKESKIMNVIERVSVRFMWFVAGAFFGYLWMAEAYGLL